MYQTGDYVVCRNGGIWRITDLQTTSGTSSIYTLCSYGEGKHILTVPGNSDEIVRRILDKSALAEILQRVPFIRTIQAPNDRVRQEFYREAMSQFDELEWIKVIKTVYLRQQESRVSSSELAYSAKAKEYLHTEVAILFDMPLEQVERYIADIVTSDDW